MGGRLINLVRRAVTMRWLDGLWTPLTRGSVPILMLHRFEGSERTHRGFPVSVLERQLAMLRRRGFTALPLGEAFELIKRGRPVARTFSLTVDDGYDDFYRDALPVFAAARCPVTLFVTTGFIDETTWMWWDQVRWVLENTRSTSLDIMLGARRWQERWSSPVDRNRLGRALVEWFKTIPDQDRRAGITSLASALSVVIPGEAPGAYRPMTWSEVRQAAAEGVTFGPHTVTHPILAQCDDQSARAEIEQSWRRLQEEVPGAALPIFCYPNGTPADQGAREFAILEQLGFVGAVTTKPGRAGRNLMTVAATQQFEMPRFAHPASDHQLLQLVLGLDRDRN